MLVLIGSHNPGKIDSTKITFERYFDDVEVVGLAVSSDVPEQPIDKQTYDGAKNRVKNLKKEAGKQNIQADYYVSVESGMIELYGKHFIVSYAVVEDKNRVVGTGISCAFPVPDHLVDDVKKEGLTVVLKKYLGDNQVVPTGHGGITNLTDGSITRVDLGVQALTMATIPHRKSFWR